MATFYEAFQIKRNWERKIMQTPNIVAVGIGYADPKNPNKGAGVNIYTSNELPAKPSFLSIQTKTKKITCPVRYIKTGKIISYDNVTQRIRPVPPGVSLEARGIGGSGTAGLIVKSLSSNQLYILSNNHVLAANSPTFRTVHQPAFDARDVSKDVIGNTDRYVPLSLTGVNFMDAATCRPLQNSLLNPRYGGTTTVPGHVTSYRVGDRFRKLGASTGLTRGTVESIATTVILITNFGRFTMRTQTVVRSERGGTIAAPGDSGSVFLVDDLLSENNNYAAAVLFGGPIEPLDRTRAFCYPIERFMRAFRTVVAKPGGTSGEVKKVNWRKSYAYERPLSPKELEQIKVITVKKSRTTS